MIGIAVIGYGYWGPNLVRNFWETPGARLVVGLRPAVASASRACGQRYPAVETTTDYDELLRDPRVDAVAIATPVSSHFELAMQALAGRQARVRREADDGDDRARRAGWSTRPTAAAWSLGGRPHLRLHRRRPQDARAGRRRRPRRHLLLRLGAREPRPVPARRQRDLGPRRARPVDHGLRAAGAAGGRLGDRHRATCRASRRTSPT